MGIQEQNFGARTSPTYHQRNMAEAEQQISEQIISVAEQTEDLSVEEVSDEVSTKGEVTEEVSETSAAGAESGEDEVDAKTNDSEEATIEEVIKEEYQEEEPKTSLEKDAESID